MKTLKKVRDLLGGPSVILFSKGNLEMWNVDCWSKRLDSSTPVTHCQEAGSSTRKNLPLKNHEQILLPRSPPPPFLQITFS